MKKRFIVLAIIVLLAMVNFVNAEVNEMERIEMLYDDRNVLKEVPEDNLKITTKEVLSTNSVTGEKDKDVVIYDEETNALIAVGVGTAEVEIDGVVKEYTVKPAPISVFLIVGHSLGQGYCGNMVQSIANIPGQVYSTYSADEADQLTYSEGLGLGFGSQNRPDRIDANCDIKAGGTIGEGSGIAYRWTRLTGEKVWIVNTAHGATNLNTWQPGAADYEHTLEQMGYVQDILSRELRAGHYTFSHTGIINHTCANGDDDWDQGEYKTKFDNMRINMCAALAFDYDGDGVKEEIEFFGIIPSWRISIINQDNNLFPIEDRIKFNNGRLANYTLATLENGTNIFLANNNRVWTTDEGVAAYFAKEGDLYDTNYPTQNGITLKEPTVMVKGVFDDGVHYTQTGYNALGMSIAQNIYNYLNKVKAESVILYDDDGLTVIEDNHTMRVGDNIKMVAIPEPVSVNDLTFEASGSVRIISTYNVKAMSAGIGTFTVKQGDKVLRSVTIKVLTEDGEKLESSVVESSSSEISVPENSSNENGKKSKILPILAGGAVIAAIISVICAALVNKKSKNKR